MMRLTKSTRCTLGVLQVCLAWLCLTPALAQPYSLDWSTTDGGGGTSSGGGYTLEGTVGQPDTGEVTGGDYRIVGGFWPGIIVPSAEAPTLFLQFVGDQLQLGWSPDSAGFILTSSMR